MTERAMAPAAGSLVDLDAAAVVHARLSADAPAETKGVLREQFIAECLPFARRLARRYRGRGEPIDDLEQVARLGLVQAVDRYAPERGSFTAYAVVTITGELKRHFRDKAWSVHVPRRLQELNLAAGHAVRELTAELTRTPVPAEIARRLGVSESDVVEALGSGSGYSPLSLNATLGADDGASEFGDLLGGTDHELEAVDDKITVAALMQRLPPREQQLLAMRFYGNKTQAQIAAELGISQMHVSRLLSRTLTWLREGMLNDTPSRWEGADVAARPADVEIVSWTAGEVQWVQVRGEVDRDVAGRLRQALLHAVEARPAEVIADFSAVALIDAGGVAALADSAAAARTAAVGLQLTGVRPYVAHVLKIAGLAGLMR